MHSLKGEVQILEKNISELNKRILKEQKTIKALKAEWSHLDNPNRLDRLNKQYLDLTRVLPESIHTEKSFAFTDGLKEKKLAQK